MQSIWVTITFTIRGFSLQFFEFIALEYQWHNNRRISGLSKHKFGHATSIVILNYDDWRLHMNAQSSTVLTTSDDFTAAVTRIVEFEVSAREPCFYTYT